jgi:hypothetical protein
MRRLEYPGAGRRWDIRLVESGLWVYSVAAGTGVVSRRGIYRKKDARLMTVVERGRPEVCCLRSIMKTTIRNATGELVFHDAWSVCFVADI